MQDGFGTHASGLLVPDHLARLREVITADEYKTLTRAITKVLGPHAIKFLLICGHAGCSDTRIEKTRLADGTVTLRCGCRDRVVPKVF